jgi:ATP-binding cassette subfamily B protein
LKSLFKLKPYFIRHRYRLILGLLFVTASNLFAVFPAQLVRKSLDSIAELLNTEGSNQEFIYDEMMALIIKFSVLILSFALIKGVFMYLMRQTIIVMSRLIEFDMKNDIFNHYQQLGQAFYRRNSTGDLMARISEDVSRVRMFTGPAIMYMMNLIVTIVVVLWAMFSVNFQLSLWVLAPLPILSAIILYVNNIINRKSDEIQSKLSDLTTKAQETFAGMRVVKSFGLEQIWQRIFEKETLSYRQKNLSLAQVDAMFFPSMLFLTGLSSLFTIWIGGNQVAQGIITVGNIAEFTIYVNILVWPVTALGYTISLTQRAAASQQRINLFLDEPADIQQGSFLPFKLQRQISFDNVTFTYEGKSVPALKSISFICPVGKTTAIIGTTGSGKTTLLQLLMGVYSPDQGQIKIDGVPLSQIDIKQMRNQIGYATQDVFLFSDTIRNNILFGDVSGNVNDESVYKAARLAAVHEHILSFRDGYDTLVGERGVTLSGGQKQRIALARALIRNPEILLLDDTLSAVDAETEQQIISELKEHLSDTTVLMVTHRAAAAAIAHHIIVLEEGEIVEQGSFEYLAGLKGKFYNVIQSQQSTSPV